MDQAFVPEKASKLVVRVKIDSSIPDDDPIAVEVTEFNPVAIAILIAVLIIVAGGGYYFFSSSSEPSLPSEFVELSVSESVVSDSSAVESPAIELVSEELSVDSSIESASATHQNIALIPLTEIADEPIVSARVKTLPLVASVSTGISTDVNEAKVPLLGEPEIQNKPVTLSKAPLVKAGNTDDLSAIPEPSSSAPQITNKVNTHLSKHVARAHFSFEIKNREPVNIVQETIPLKLGGIEKINFFTELKNLKGQSIRHVWFLNDKLVTEIKFNVRGNRWRVYSSKLLDKSAVGTWKVKVINEAGDIMKLAVIDYK